MSTKLTGLLIGAGASYEVGMPLVWELTAELKAWLTPQKLRELNDGWKAQGERLPEEVINDFASILTLPELHYESILGHLETQFRRLPAMTKHYHWLYSWLVQTVYIILYVRHIKNTVYLQKNLHYMEGILHLIDNNKPLWIFSLNHDLIIECLAAEYHIPLCSGFENNTFNLPRRDKSGAKIGELKAETITGERLQHSAMPFLQLGNRGINLLKIHGALDVFTFNDGKDLLKLCPVETSAKGVLESLRAANEELLCTLPESPGSLVKVINEIIYTDDVSEIQFLRRTLLAGSYKFNKQFSQVLPMCLLDHFRSSINYISTLVCIGYSLSDVHINQVIREWLEFNADRKLEIVGPDSETVPSFLLHLTPQITLRKTIATDYLDSIAGIFRPRHDTIKKRFAAWYRSRKSEVANIELQEYFQEYLKARLQDLPQWIASLHRQEGNLDIDAIKRQWYNEPGNAAEDAMEAFLNKYTPKT